MSGLVQPPLSKTESRSAAFRYIAGIYLSCRGSGIPLSPLSGLIVSWVNSSHGASLPAFTTPKIRILGRKRP